ncbi:peptidase M23-like protein [Prosthecobacter fusiformis]|uniref:Peptidase M23-like protein n=1 Tax=Prosthecobacter fusiformis TaxID=48464 RepID=A0A4R7STY8_9BACT|nr:M23 family metallopeptidase [Prosthecobacter fusiformis]TDU81777.1 peptidase M23-like protein [Prosthecobacter fusiformis]
MVFLAVLLFCGQGMAAGFVRCQLADGFDFPVGKPNSDGYYKSRGYWPNGHLGEDWNGKAGGDSDLGDPIYATARGVVVISENIGVGWGNCIIVRHAYRDETGKIAMVDSLYAHLHQRMVKVGQTVEKGQLVGTMGGNNGMYLVHLHFEMRKNLRIGMNRSQFARDNSNYYSPTDFINKHRVLPTSFQKYPIPLGIFAPYGRSLADARSDGGETAVKVPTLPSTQRNLPDTGPSADDEDFWSKLRTRLKQGKMTEGVDPPP